MRVACAVDAVPGTARAILTGLIVLILSMGGLPGAGSMLTARPARAEEARPSRTITYQILFNGAPASEEGRILVETSGASALVRQVLDGRPLDNAPEEAGWICYEDSTTWQTARFRDGRKIAVRTPFRDLPALEMTAIRRPSWDASAGRRQRRSARTPSKCGSPPARTGQVLPR